MRRPSSGVCQVPLLVALCLVGCGGDSPNPTAPDAPDTSPPIVPTTAPPIAGNASVLNFDGANDRVTVPYSASFPTEVFTIVARVRLSPPGGRAAILARGEDNVSLNLSWQLYVLADGTLEIMLEEARENNMCYPSNSCVPRGTCDAPNPFVADGAWHHVAARRDAGGNLAVFVDGVRRASCQGTGVPSANNRQVVSIGCTFGTIGPPAGGIQPAVWFFPGLIDEPAMWSRALGDAEIASISANGVDPGSAGLVGYWSFDEGAGQVVSDGSTAGNHGFLGESAGADGADPRWEAP